MTFGIYQNIISIFQKLVTFGHFFHACVMVRNNQIKIGSIAKWCYLANISKWSSRNLELKIYFLLQIRICFWNFYNKKVYFFIKFHILLEFLEPCKLIWQCHVAWQNVAIIMQFYHAIIVEPLPKFYQKTITWPSRDTVQCFTWL